MGRCQSPTTGRRRLSAETFGSKSPTLRGDALENHLQVVTVTMVDFNLQIVTMVDMSKFDNDVHL